MKKIRYCSVCKRYTLEKIHCDRLSLSAHPMPFKPLDQYGSYRRAAKFMASTKQMQNGGFAI